MKLPNVKPPIEMVPNATVYFEVPTGEFRVEKATRNKIALTTEKSIKAWITELGDRFMGEESPGSNLTERRVRGYFLIQKMPPGLRGSDRVRVELQTSGVSETVTLFFNERSTPLRDIVISNLGIPFEGYIQNIGGAY